MKYNGVAANRRGTKWEVIVKEDSTWTWILIVQSPSRVWLFVAPRTKAHQASLSLTISQSLPKFMFIALVMPSSHLILWSPLLLLPSIFPSIRDFSSELAVSVRWPKYCSFTFSFSLSSEYLGLILLTVDWFDLLAAQGTLRSFLQCQTSSLKASIFWCSLTFCLQSSSHNHTWPLGRLYSLDYMDFCRQSNVSTFQPSV